jgi:protein-disulfide isomerase
MAEDKPKNEKTIVIDKKIIIAVVVVIVIVVAWFFFSSNMSGEYIESYSPILGNPNATVSVVEFSDYECPFCQAAEGANQQIISSLKQSDPTWQAPVPNIIETYVNAGKVKLIFRQFPVHGNNKPALASECAQEQGKFWDYHNILFENYNSLSDANLKIYAANISLNMTQFDQCFDSGKYIGNIQKDLSDGQALGVSGTPTFFIGSNETGYTKIEGAASFSAFEQVINSKLS